MPSMHQAHTRIARISDLGTTSVEDIISEIRETDKTKILMLPALYSEFESRKDGGSPVMNHILEELKKADYIDHIILGLDAATEEEYKSVVQKMEALPQNVHVMWNDGPIADWRNSLAEDGLAPTEKGKGRNVWGMMGYALHLIEQEGKKPEDAAIAMHDCDIVTYDESMPAKLFHPLCTEDADYVKGHYPRHDGEKLNGRVTRLFVPGYIKALRNVFGDNEEVRQFLDYIDSYDYPLAGDMAFSGKALKQLQLPSDWSIEVEILMQMFEHPEFDVFDVNIADKYDHKHQGESGLDRMVTEIAAAFLRKIQGIQEEQEAKKNPLVRSLRRLADAFNKISGLSQNKSYDVNEEQINNVQKMFNIFAPRLKRNFNRLARCNGLNSNDDAETKYVQDFAERIPDGFAYFKEGSVQRMASWKTIQEQEPKTLHELDAIMKADRKKLGSVALQVPANQNQSQEPQRRVLGGRRGRSPQIA